MSRYASGTTVNIGKSRGQIDELLREWGCDQIMWADNYTLGRVLLRFVWKHKNTQYVARFPLNVATDEELKLEARHATTGAFLPSRFDDLSSRRGWSEHRQLLLWLKATFNAVEAGIIDPVCVFLPFLEDETGATISERIIPGLPELLKAGGVANLIPQLGDGK